VRDPGQLAHGRRRPGVAAARHRTRDPVVEHRKPQALGQPRPDLVEHHRIRDSAAGSRGGEQPLGVLAEPGAADHRGSFGRQRRPRDPPAVARRADHAVVGHEHLVKEHLVEHRPPGDLAQRAHLDSPVLHADQEVGDPLVLRRGRRGGGQRQLARRLVRGAGRVPGRRRRELGPAQHLRAQVLDRLERADRAAELLPGACVLGRGLAAPGGDAGGLGGGQRRGDVGHQPRAEAKHQPGLDGDGIEPDVGQRAGEVHRRPGGQPDAWLPCVEQEPGPAALCGRPEQQVRGVRGPEHEPGRAARPQAPDADIATPTRAAPDASPASTAQRAPSPAAPTDLASTSPASSVGMTGPGASAAASRSATTATSAVVPPAPPR